MVCTVSGSQRPPGLQTMSRSSALGIRAKYSRSRSRSRAPVVTVASVATTTIDAWRASAASESQLRPPSSSSPGRSGPADDRQQASGSRKASSNPSGSLCRHFASVPGFGSGLWGASSAKRSSAVYFGPGGRSIKAPARSCIGERVVARQGQAKALRPRNCGSEHRLTRGDSMAYNSR